MGCGRTTGNLHRPSEGCYHCAFSRILNTINGQEPKLQRCIPANLKEDDDIVLDRALDELDALRKREQQRVKRCHACAVEAEFGTEEDPHPIADRFHTCNENIVMAAVRG